MFDYDNQYELTIRVLVEVAVMIILAIVVIYLVSFVSPPRYLPIDTEFQSQEEIDRRGDISLKYLGGMRGPNRMYQEVNSDQ